MPVAAVYKNVIWRNDYISVKLTTVVAKESAPGKSFVSLSARMASSAPLIDCYPVLFMPWSRFVIAETMVSNSSAKHFILVPYVGRLVGR